VVETTTGENRVESRAATRTRPNPANSRRLTKPAPRLWLRPQP
jgi:hypothetical protein